MIDRNLLSERSFLKDGESGVGRVGDYRTCTVLDGGQVLRRASGA